MGYIIHVTFVKQTKKDILNGIYRLVDNKYPISDFQLTSVNLVLHLVDGSVVRIPRACLIHLGFH